jgi:hypothetical protein
MGYKDVDCIHVAQNSIQLQFLLNMVMNFQVSWETREFLTSWATVSVWRITLHRTDS